MGWTRHDFVELYSLDRVDYATHVCSKCGLLVEMERGLFGWKLPKDVERRCTGILGVYQVVGTTINWPVVDRLRVSHEGGART